MKRFKWILIAIAALCVVVYFAIGAVVGAILTTPQRQFSATEPPAGIPRRDVRFPARKGDAQIAGWFMARQPNRGTAVIVHGKDCSRTIEFNGEFPRLAAALNQERFSVLMIDLRGHGQSSDAHFSFGLNERRDVQGAVDWLKSEGINPIVPFANAMQLKAAAPSAEMWTSSGPEHARTYNADPTAYVSKVADFFGRNLQPGDGPGAVVAK